MSFTDARAFCPDLVSLPARPDLEARFLAGLRRWAAQWSPWIGSEGRDGLVMDITGTAHLFGGEAAMLSLMRQGLARARVAGPA